MIPYNPPYGENSNFTIYNDIYVVPDGDKADFRINGGTMFEGNGVLSGVVRVDGENQIGCIVSLYSEKTQEYLTSSVTDSNGMFVFEHLNTEELFYIVAKEPSGAWEYRVSSRRKPVETASKIYSVVGSFEQKSNTGSIDGVMIIVGGVAPYSVSVVTGTLPSGITPIINGRYLILDGFTHEYGEWDSTIRVSDSNGSWVDIDLSLDIYIRETAVFTESGTYIVPAGVTEVEALIVAGGGGGGSRQGGGGGGGGVIFTTVAVIPGTHVSVVVGPGGSGGVSGGRGSNGANSSFGAVVAIGGGGGGGRSESPQGSDGGSGGGSARNGSLPGGLGMFGQGRAGGRSTIGQSDGNVGGGGGGAFADGSNGTGTETTGRGGDGGDGVYISLFSAYGHAGYFGGGGGGGVSRDATGAIAGIGGLGGGGDGAGPMPLVDIPGFPGMANTGGGGGGSNVAEAAGGAGGSGVVIVRPIA